jgi:hypothetical protein
MFGTLQGIGMTLDFQQVQLQVREMGKSAPARQEELRQRREEAQALMENCAGEIEELRRKVQDAVELDASLRCALPVILPDGTPQHLNAHYPLPPLPAQATILAADGSQIDLDRHAEVEYGLVNVGAIQMRLGSPQPPSMTIRCELIADEQLENLTVAGLALKRDIQERSMLVELAARAPAPVITFTDGPMELWGSKEAISAGQASEYQRNLKQYLDVLDRLCSLGAITAGYVDKPSANLVVRLLEVARATPEDLRDLRQYRPLRGVSDRFMYRDLLESGERSSVFAMQTQSAKNYPGHSALHFFYLNVGHPGQPWVARVEAPQWVVSDPAKLDSLHAVLVDQCRILGGRAYPYLLHRAHETALVSHQEREQVTNMIALELRKRGIYIEGISQKQAAKNLAGRTRH